MAVAVAVAVVAGQRHTRPLLSVGQVFKVFFRLLFSLQSGQEQASVPTSSFFSSRNTALSRCPREELRQILKSKSFEKRQSKSAFWLFLKKKRTIRVMVTIINPVASRFMDKKLSVKLNANRHVTGVLRGFDQFMNIVLENAVEEVTI